MCWSWREESNLQPAVYKWKLDVFEKARCFKWFPHFSFFIGLLGGFYCFH